ncbi:uncharacterized protein ASCRUDRAFT_75698 [Ascoidea rubescens DSM 1968]|uniref:Uncharacterized protein n=1 Tax=Ascoidea rubescens DSM 1968 TaxID=1344418 RepID=A0A1D2VH61_9ASCO|nr:hypothetical protein ASCRUDRAFT_75698 [Ascoidea rubescens DSM 1968]ODV60939.1 hypothetical protein ASCRUDRAFT_75698 [Ascoidea rubescens DSM 1968]
MKNKNKNEFDEKFKYKDGFDPDFNNKALSMGVVEINDEKFKLDSNNYAIQLLKNRKKLNEKYDINPDLDQENNTNDDTNTSTNKPIKNPIKNSISKPISTNDNKRTKREIQPNKVVHPQIISSILQDLKSGISKEMINRTYNLDREFLNQLGDFYTVATKTYDDEIKENKEKRRQLIRMKKQLMISNDNPTSEMNTEKNKENIRNIDHLLNNQYNSEKFKSSDETKDDDDDDDDDLFNPDEDDDDDKIVITTNR